MITVESVKSLTIPILKKYGYLEKEKPRWGNISWSVCDRPNGNVSVFVDADNTALNLRYQLTDLPDSDEKKNQDYNVPLITTPCHFGGVRYWFSCIICHQRISHLYLAGKYVFACRKCWNLTYESRNAGGWQKRLGTIKSDPELREFCRTKRFYYRGKPTKSYRRYIRYQRQWQRHDRLWMARMHM